MSCCIVSVGLGVQGGEAEEGGDGVDLELLVPKLLQLFEDRHTELHRPVEEVLTDPIAKPILQVIADQGEQ
jgi:dihydroxyacetone kinase